MRSDQIKVGEQPLTIDDVVRLVRVPDTQVELSEDGPFRERIEASVRHLERHYRDNKVVYGVTTGVGDSCVRSVPEDLVGELSRQISRFHGCGLGRNFDEDTSLAILLVRLVSLARGYSAVRFELLELLRDLINNRIIPRIPEEGSVGASGDLTPLSYVAAVIMGEREVWQDGALADAGPVLAAAGLTPLELGPKEGLALMNGTAVMTAVACLAFDRAQHLSRLATRLTAMVSEVLHGNKAHFDSRISACKPHPGQVRVMGRIAADLQYDGEHDHDPENRIQDTYAIRCAPHVIGVLEDALEWARSWIETELNSVNDNPLIDPENGDVLHGGNFYGGHIAFAMDALKTAVANVADLLDRQMALLVNDKRNRGLPLNLSGASAERLPVNHGFKAIQIACSAWTAEALKLCLPASVFSRSTESHNQDKVSMGTIAARDCIRVLELTEQVFAGSVLGAAQAFDLRVRAGELAPDAIGSGLRNLHAQVRKTSELVTEDRPLEGDLRQLLERIRAQTLKCEWSNE